MPSGALVLFYGTEPVRQAQALLDRSERYFGLPRLGADMEGSAMHGHCWRPMTSYSLLPPD